MAIMILHLTLSYVKWVQVQMYRKKVAKAFGESLI